MLEPVALCCAATLSSGGFFQQNLSVDSFEAAAGGAATELRAAVVPHVALQLMPDVRPLLPRLHGFFTRPDGAAAGRERLWLAYDSSETSLAAHLDSRPTSAIPTKATVRIPRRACAPPCLPLSRNMRRGLCMCVHSSPFPRLVCTYVHPSLTYVIGPVQARFLGLYRVEFCESDKESCLSDTLLPD